LSKDHHSNRGQGNSESNQQSGDHKSDESLSDMLNEMRVLLPGAQTLTAFLIIVPFNSSFQDLGRSDRLVYVITFLCSLIALLLFAAPAAHHRLERPLIDRAGFKDFATRFILAGLFFLSVALVLATELVIAQVWTQNSISWGVAGLVALLVLTVWWLLPRNRIQRLKARIARGEVDSPASKS
jgi:hypothetical protein